MARWRTRFSYIRVSPRQTADNIVIEIFVGQETGHYSNPFSCARSSSRFFHWAYSG